MRGAALAVTYVALIGLCPNSAIAEKQAAPGPDLHWWGAVALMSPSNEQGVGGTLRGQFPLFHQVVVGIDVGLFYHSTDIAGGTSSTTLWMAPVTLGYRVEIGDKLGITPRIGATMQYVRTSAEAVSSVKYSFVDETPLFVAGATATMGFPQTTRLKVLAGFDAVFRGPLHYFTITFGVAI